MSKKCEKCGRFFSRKYTLLEHIKKNICEKYNNLEFKCTKCPKSYSKKKLLLNHIKNKHNNKQDDKKIKCSLCEKSFSNQGNLNKHLANLRCKFLKNDSVKNVSINNNSNNNNNNDNSVNINNNNINININFGKEKLDDWFYEVGKSVIEDCIRDIDKIPINLLEAKHVISKKNRNIYLPKEEDKYKYMFIYDNGWKKIKTTKILQKMLGLSGDDLFDLIQNHKKYKLRLSKKSKKDLDKKITDINKDKFLQGPLANMLLKNKEILKDNFNKTREVNI